MSMCVPCQRADRIRVALKALHLLAAVDLPHTDRVVWDRANGHSDQRVTHPPPQSQSGGINAPKQHGSRSLVVQDASRLSSRPRDVVLGFMACTL